MLAAATLAAVTGIVAVSTLGHHMTSPRAPAHFTAFPARVANVPAHRDLAAIFGRKTLIVVPAPSEPSAYDREQQMSHGDLLKRWNPAIMQASKRFGVPAAWIRAVMQLESGGRTMLGENQPIISHAGAMGLMQLMPSTYRDMRRQYGLGTNPFDPHDNILAGAAYLRFLRGKYAFPVMFEAYNDGPGHLEERLKNGGLLPAETQNYVANITRRLEGRGGVSRVDMAKLTRPDGGPVWVNAAAAISVRAPIPGEYASGVQSVVKFGRSEQGVRESVAMVKRTLRSHGAAV
jgi:hypothetical protein